MKKIVLVVVIILLMVFIFFFIHENKEENEQNEIFISVKDSEIKLETKTRVLDTVNYEDSQLFQAIMDNDSDIPYVELGEIIQIKFKGKVPDTYELKDYILKKDGTLKFKKVMETININIKNKTASFTLKPNKWISFSSHMKDYEAGSTIRGFRLLCEWSGKKHEYVFILNTDPLVM